MSRLGNYLRRWWRLGVPASMDALDAASIQYVLSRTRVVLAVVAVTAVWLDPAEPEVFERAATIVLAGFAVYAVAILLVGVRDTAWLTRRWRWLHAIDLAWFWALTWFTGGIASPFFAFFVYGAIAAAFRWGLVAAMLTALCSAGLVLAQFGAVLLGFPGSEVHSNVVITRLAYLIIGGLLIGLLAEQGHKQRAAAVAIARIMQLVQMERGLVASVTAVLGELVKRFSASRIVLTLDEEGNEKLLLWELTDARPEVKHRVRPRYLLRSDAQALAYASPGPADAWYAERSGPGNGADGLDTLAVDGLGRRLDARPAVQQLLGVPFAWRSVHGVSSISGAGWKGWLLVFDGMAFRDVKDDLRFLQAVIRLVAPALFNLYLQRRVQSRVGFADRTRVSQKLHDGIVQTLVGLEMQVDAVRRQAAGVLPSAAADQLAAIQRVLSEEGHEVRDLMELMRPAAVEPALFVDHLADLVARFRRRTGIHARFESDAEGLRLPARTCRELAGAVQEALANVRRHSGASHVLVRVSAAPSGCRILVDDDGKGFGFDGRLTDIEFDETHVGPAMIRERIRSVAGTLAVESRPGVGSRIEITVPAAVAT
jgi:signal transduction histidine kinase